MNKKIIYLVSLTIGLLSLSSCEENKDFDPTYVIPNYFVGQWELTQIGSTNSANVIYYDDVVKDENCEFDNVVLGADYNFAENDYSSDGECSLETFNGKYAIANGSLILTHNDLTPEDAFGPEVENFSVVALTNTNMELSYPNGSGDLVFLKFTKKI